MLLGIFTLAALGPLVVVGQTMKTADYLNRILDQLHPFTGTSPLYIVSDFPIENEILLQDNVQYHKARVVLEWFEEHKNEFQLISWSPDSPDLNSIIFFLDCHGKA